MHIAKQANLYKCCYIIIIIIQLRQSLVSIFIVIALVWNKVYY